MTRFSVETVEFILFKMKNEMLLLKRLKDDTF